jgi:hypothetical protein
MLKGKAGNLRFLYFFINGYSKNKKITKNIKKISALKELNM